MRSINMTLTLNFHRLTSCRSGLLLLLLLVVIIRHNSEAFVAVNKKVSSRALTNLNYYCRQQQQSNYNLPEHQNNFVTFLDTTKKSSGRYLSLFHNSNHHRCHERCCHQQQPAKTSVAQRIFQQGQGFWKIVQSRIDTIDAAGLDSTKIQTAGIGSVLKKIARIHDPITYFVLFILAGFKWDWCFKSPLYWFVVGFTIKWYRARYVFKLPVWDRQPNWNNIITSKEQEKDLKAYTCKNCGSTLFIAKTREFFFEGDTGFGGLGCFSCGAKGPDNFVMDRERIVEDVGDMDDYFEYERPLDFISRAERRKLLKQSGGDEAKANQILVERAAAAAAAADETTATLTPSTAASPEVVDAVIEEEIQVIESPVGSEITESVIVTSESSTNDEEETPKPKKSKKKKKKKASTLDDSTTETKKPNASESLDGLDVLDMDSF